jgi:GT2 family glycosyltransferase
VRHRASDPAERGGCPDPRPAGPRVGDPGLHVVIVAYGPPGQLHEALTELGGAFPVVVVDNSSSDHTRSVVESAGARYVDSGANVGFAAAVNRALGALDLQHTDVLLLNPDARIAPADVELLHAVLRREERVACVAPSFRARGESVEDPFLAWDTPAGAWAEAAGMRRRGAGRYLSGAVLLLRGAAVSEVGLLDERFFLYCEEEDWQKRASERGWRLVHCKEAVASHAGGGTDRDMEKVALRLHCAIERYVRKWYGPAGWLAYRAATLVGQSARWIVFTCLGRRPATRRSAARMLRMYSTGPERAALSSGVVPAR